MEEEISRDASDTIAEKQSKERLMALHNRFRRRMSAKEICGKKALLSRIKLTKT